MFRLTSLLGLALTPLLLAEDSAELFTSRVQPALKTACFGCHGDGQVMSKLDLTTREGLLQGGTRGPAIVPGDASRSLLYKAVLGHGLAQMPPGDASKRLPSEDIDAIGRWINAGAPWAQAKQSAWGNFRGEDLWAFRPPRKEFSRRSIDEFLDARLAERGIKPGARADRRTLIRRAAIDLTGLPPTPEEVDGFVKDQSPHAWLKVIDRLLASPHYGERWGRHWLDVVRYADSSGYSNDFERPNAWRYRDYVIRAFNNDKPYDQFVREQIAGDEMYPGNPEAVIATGFLRAGPWEHTAMSVEALTRQMFLDDVTNTVGVTFLGVTVGCARCHDHKFDPVPTRDYYRLQAIFASTEFTRPKIPFLKEENVLDLEAGKARMQEIARRTEQSMKAFDEEIKRTLMVKHGVSQWEDIPQKEREDALRTKKMLEPEQYEHFKLYQKHLQLYRESLDRYNEKAFAVSSGPLDGFTDGGPNLKYPKRAEYKPMDVHILPGGNIESPAEKVAPGVLQLVERYASVPSPAVPESVEGRRAVLANWITRPDNPLTARVMVNRIWQYHFGKGIAADSNNFGKMGRKPTHPELLDWLANEFIQSGWSVKAMHRLIMQSKAYQRASSHASMPDVRSKDPNNDLLASFSPRRVEAEVLRDSILFVSGELSPVAGGPGTFPQLNEDIARQPLHRMGSLAPAYRPSAKKRERNRRTIYTFQQRSLIDPMIEVFNGPNLDMSCERRESSTVPTQAFALLNSRFIHDVALAMASRIEKEAPTPEARIDRAFQLVYNRKPTGEEAALALTHLRRQSIHHQANPAPKRPAAKPIVHMITSELTGERFQFTQQESPEEYEHNLHPSEVAPETRALADIALVLLNSNEFVYIN